MLPVTPTGKEALPCDETTRSYLAAALMRQIQAMRLEVPGVREAADIEYIHRMRVASRRARNLLPLMEGCVPDKRVQTWGRHLRGITRALGAARDTDVQMDLLAGFEAGLSEPRLRAGVRRLLLRLRQQRSSLQTTLLEALQRLENEGTLEKIEKSLVALLPDSLPAGASPTHVLYQRAAHFVQRCLDEFLSFEPFIHDPENVTELHAMRISAKHLRYTLETFGALYSDGMEEEIRTVRKVQDYLGEIHDCDVWAEYLPVFIDEERERALSYYGHLRAFSYLLPGLTRFARDRAEQRGAVYQEFIQRWDKWTRRPVKKGERLPNYWEQLRQRVCQPLLPEQIYPPLAAESLVEEPAQEPPISPAPPEDAPNA